MRTKFFFSSLAVAVMLFTACNKETVKKEVFSGYAQKGPFAVGTSITIAELKGDLKPTGKTYLTTISDNSGSFELTNIELVSNYVELKVDGYFFQEVGGGLSISPITLYALADIASVTSANVNVLTHLEKPRVEYLVKQGQSFAAAKQQAQREVLTIFGFNPPQASSEALNLVDNAMLIAISCILQGNNGTTGDLTEFMANISNDIKTDGKLDNTALGAKLKNNAYVVSLAMDYIRENIETKYAELGNHATIPDFESYIQSFVNSNLYSQTLISYPKTGLYGDNILSDAVTSIRRGANYSMYVNINEGLALTINMLCAKEADFDFLYDKSVVNWRGSQSGNQGNEYRHQFSAYKGSSDMQVRVLGTEEYITIEYWENSIGNPPATPTKTKRLRVLD